MTQARDRLLRTAYTLFSRYGFTGMSMRLLSRQAGANNAAVVYHFGSKTGLYVAVLLLAVDTLEADAERVAGWIERGLPAELPPAIEEAFRLLAREALDRRLPTTLEPRLAAKLPPEALRRLSRLAARFSPTALAAAVAGRAVAEPLGQLLQMWSAGFGDSAPSFRAPRRGPDHPTESARRPQRNEVDVRRSRSPSNLPQRRGPRPSTTRSNPHTQLDQNAPEELQRALAARIFALDGVEERPSLVSVPGARALWLREASAPGGQDAFLVGREFAHLHPPYDGSLHAALPPEVAATAIAAGWAEPHPLALRGAIPGTIVMLYGPRDLRELEVIGDLVTISWEFARGRENAGGHDE